MEFHATIVRATATMPPNQRMHPTGFASLVRRFHAIQGVGIAITGNIRRSYSYEQILTRCGCVGQHLLGTLRPREKHPAARCRKHAQTDQCSQSRRREAPRLDSTLVIIPKQRRIQSAIQCLRSQRIVAERSTPSANRTISGIRSTASNGSETPGGNTGAKR